MSKNMTLESNQHMLLNKGFHTRVGDGIVRHVLCLVEQKEVSRSFSSLQEASGKMDVLMGQMTSHESITLCYQHYSFLL